MTFRSLTPPKYVAALGEKKAVVDLEDRLDHFLKWLWDNHEVALVFLPGMDNPAIGAKNEQGLIRDYVNG